MKKLLLFSCTAILSLCSSVFAQTSIAPNSWTSSGASATGPSSFASVPASTTPGSTQVIFSQFERGSALTNSGTSTAYVSTGWSTATTETAAFSAGSYVMFTVTNSSTKELTIVSFALRVTTNAQGPTSLQMSYVTSGTTTRNYFGTVQTGTAGSTYTVNVTPTAQIYLCAGQTDTFYVTGWGGTATTGRMAIENNTAVNAQFVNALTAGAINVAGGRTFCSPANLNMGVYTISGGIGTPTYQWNGPAGFSSTRNPTTRNPTFTSGSGIYSFTVTDRWGCTVKDTANIVVDSTPLTPTISPSGTVTICSNDSIVFTTPLVAGLTYQWDTGAYATPIHMPGATNTTYVGRGQGRYRVTVTSANGCWARTTPPTTVWVKSAPSAAITASGPLGFCTGGSVTLSAPLTSTASYQWYDSTSAISGATSNIYTERHSAQDRLVVTDTNGCVSNSIMYAITEVSTPVVSAAGTTIFCVGNSVVLNVDVPSSASGITIKWIRNSVDTILGATTPSYTATSSGNYVCFISIPGSCADTSNSMEVDVHALPAPVMTFNGTYVSTASTYLSYQWYLNTIAIPGATNYRVNAYANGSYRVWVSDIWGCSNLSDEKIVNNLAVSSVQSNDEVTVFPNPISEGMLHVSAPARSMVELVSMDGRTLQSGRDLFNLSVDGLNDGIYLIRVTSENGALLYNNKFVKQ